MCPARPQMSRTLKGLGRCVNWRAADVGMAAVDVRMGQGDGNQKPETWASTGVGRHITHLTRGRPGLAPSGHGLTRLDRPRHRLFRMPLTSEIVRSASGLALMFDGVTVLWERPPHLLSRHWVGADDKPAAAEESCHNFPMQPRAAGMRRKGGTEMAKYLMSWKTRSAGTAQQNHDDGKSCSTRLPSGRPRRTRTTRSS